MAKYRDSEFAAWAADHFDWNLKPTVIDLEVNRIPDELRFDAQRKLDGERSKGIAECFMPAVAAGVIVAELPDGRLVFIDGQHRWKAAKDAGVETIPALLFHMSEAQAAAFFRLKNGRAVNGTRHIESTHAGYQADYGRSVHIYNILESFDCFLDREGATKEGSIGASQAIEKIYAVDEGDLLALTLEVITESLGHTRLALSSEMLEGISLFLAHHHDDLRAAEMRDLKARMKEQGIDDLLAQAKASYKRVRGGVRLPYHVEMEVTTTYNRRRTATRLEDRSPRQLAQMPDLAHMARANRAAKVASQPKVN